MKPFLYLKSIFTSHLFGVRRLTAIFYHILAMLFGNLPMADFPMKQRHSLTQSGQERTLFGPSWWEKWGENDGEHFKNDGNIWKPKF
jgi:hypothetical protein